MALLDNRSVIETLNAPDHVFERLKVRQMYAANVTLCVHQC